MCGIAGIYKFRGNVTQEHAFMDKCLCSMRRRGPDSKGVWHNEKNYITAFARLAIRDLSPNGDQPMVSACGNYCLTYNGEIYNAETFRTKLIQLGVQFKSTSDTEVLLYGLKHFGIEKVLQEFDGMFAFAFYDNYKNELTLARDRVGIKPLYIGFDKEDSIIYSSQYDHVINYASLKDESLDYGAIGTYLELGYVPDNSGAVKNTILFPHGHYAVVNSSGYSMHEYYSTVFHQKRKTALLNEEKFSGAVHEQLVSDVAVGTFLSGGVDSSLVTLWAYNAKNISAFTTGTDDPLTDEKSSAAFVTGKFKIPHYIENVTEKDFLKVLKDNTVAFTEPFADFSSIPSLVLSGFASKHIKVALSGDGPDELFAGYKRNIKFIEAGKKYFEPQVKLLAELAGSKILRKRTVINRRMFNSKDFFHFYYKSLFMLGSDLVPSFYKHEASEAFFLEQVRKSYQGIDLREHYLDAVRDLEMNIHLQRILIKVDRASMFNSLEVRVPFLSNDVIDSAMSIPCKSFITEGNGKSLLKDMLAAKTGKDFAYKTKKGFLVPMNSFLRQSVRKDVEEKLLDMPGELSVAFDKKMLERLLGLHMIKQEDYSSIIWALYALVLWYDCYKKK